MGLEYGCIVVRGHCYTAIQYALILQLTLCMSCQNVQIGLQTDCMMAVLGPVVTMPDSHVDAPWP